MKIQIVGSNKKFKKDINAVIDDLHTDNIELVFDTCKFNIKKYPAMIINNVLIDDLTKLSRCELKNVILQFFET